MCGNCTAALQRGYGHGGGGSQPCQMFGAVLQALSACAVPSARAAPHRLSSALHPEGAHGPGVLLALLWSTDVLIACPALVQGAGEMELEGDMGVTAGVAPLHPAGAGEEQPPSKFLLQPPCSRTEEKQIIVGSSTSSGGAGGHWGALVPLSACHWDHTAWEHPVACWDGQHWGWHRKGLEFGDVAAQVLQMQGAPKHTPAWGSSESTENRTEGDQNP